MEFYTRFFFQIDEARRYICDGRLECLRLALLLLDNVVEMLLSEYIAGALIRERWNERLREQWQEIGQTG